METEPKRLIHILFFSVDGIKCHQCSTFENSQCDDPFYYPEASREGEERSLWKTEEFLKECPANDGNGNAYTLCRKIYQNGEEERK